MFKEDRVRRRQQQRIRD